ncbi:hypothetical protein Ciccas_001406 [Cichlidogyrus casuarinus]|uniref:Gelsolin-like domain-containing protein n=1 Tax=Cichlidogyrus casuarinus TaxID=1844966 RepID=A0ABD2QN97_9PLAT
MIVDDYCSWQALADEVNDSGDGSSDVNKLQSLGGNSLQQFIMIGRKWLPVDSRYFGHFFSQDSFIVIARSWEFDDEELGNESDVSSKQKETSETSSQVSEGEEREARGASPDDASSGRSRTVVYFWQGRECSDVGWVTFNLSLRKDMETRLAYNAADPTHPLSVSFKHIHQQQEDIVFLAYFQRQLVIHRGKYRDRACQDRCESVQFYQLRANGNPIMTRCVEISPKVAALNSCFSYILRVPAATIKEWSPSNSYGNKDVVYLWVGSKAHPDDEALLESITARLFPKTGAGAFVTPENRENSVFWRALGGQCKYDNNADFMGQTRLFRLSNEQGFFCASEKCSDFCQDDLADDHVMLLDSGTQIFLWLGRRTSDVEVKLSLQAARLYKDYCTQVQPSMPRKLRLTAKNAEPQAFKRCFQGWGPFREAKDWAG